MYNTNANIGITWATIMFEHPHQATAWIYLRVSTDEQDTENQASGVSAYAVAHNIRIEEAISDSMSSKAPLTERTIWTMLDRMEPGNLLLVSEVSRMARNTYEVFQIAAKAAERDIHIIATKNDLKLSGTVESKIMLFMYGIAAEIEREFIRSRTTEALARIKASGRKLGRPVGRTGGNKLDGRENEILRYLEKGLAHTSMAKLLEVSRGTLETKLARMTASTADKLTRNLDLGPEQPTPANTRSAKK